MSPGDPVTITRAAGAVHGPEISATDLERIIRAQGRTPRQRSTLYGTPPSERIATAHTGGQSGHAASVPAE